MYKVKVWLKTNRNLLSSGMSVDRVHFICCALLCSRLLLKGSAGNQCYPLVFNCTELDCSAWLWGCLQSLNIDIYFMVWAPQLLVGF